jgi:hypothetical protein
VVTRRCRPPTLTERADHYAAQVQAGETALVDAAIRLAAESRGGLTAAGALDRIEQRVKETAR